MKKSKQFKPTKATGTSKFAKKSPYLTLEWTEYRNLFLKYNPRCYVCGERATVVDHIRPFRNNKELFLDTPDNFVPLCKIHHDHCTANYDRYTPPKTDEKISWMNKERAINEITIRVKVISPKR